MKSIFTFLLALVSVSIYSQDSALKERIAMLAKGVYSDVEVYPKAVALRETMNGSTYETAKVEAVLGKITMRDNDMVKAYLHFSEALELLYNADTLDHYLEYAITNNMAKINFDVARYAASAELYGKAAEAAKRYVRFEPEAAAEYKETFLPNKMTFYQGNALYDAGLIVEAQQVYQSIDESLQGSIEEVKDINTYALLRNEYGLNAKAIGNFVNSLYYFKAITSNNRVSDFYKGPAYHNMALVHKDMGNYDTALLLFDKAIAVKGNTTKRQLYISLMDKGELLIDMGNYNQAAAVLTAAMAVGVDPANDPILINAYYLAERANKFVNIAASEQYGEQYRKLTKEHLQNQNELRKIENQRVFDLSFSEARHKKRISDLEEKILIQNFLLVARWVAVASFLVYLVTAFFKRRTEGKRQNDAKRIAEE